MSGRKWSSLALVPLLLSLLLPRNARAEADTVRIAQPYGLVYLPSYVVVDRHMIEERAAAAGLGRSRWTLTRLASGPMGSDMILAGDVDLAMGGFWAGVDPMGQDQGDAEGAWSIAAMQFADARAQHRPAHPRHQGFYREGPHRRQCDQGHRPGYHLNKWRRPRSGVGISGSASIR